MKINQKVQIVNFAAFNQVTGEIVKRLDVKYSNNVADHKFEFGLADEDILKESLFLVRFDAPLNLERNGFCFGEEMMVFSERYLKEI